MVEDFVLFAPSVQEKKLSWRRTKTGNSSAKMDDHQFVVTKSQKSGMYGFLVFKDGADGPQYETYVSYCHEDEKEAKKDALQFVRDRVDIFGNDGLQRTYGEFTEALDGTDDPFDGSVNYWESDIEKGCKKVDEMDDGEYERWWADCMAMEGGKR